MPGSLFTCVPSIINTFTVSGSIIDTTTPISTLFDEPVQVLNFHTVTDTRTLIPEYGIRRYVEITPDFTIYQICTNIYFTIETNIAMIIFITAIQVYDNN